MSDERIIRHMVEFVEEKERDAQADLMKNGSKTKRDMVKIIMNELERELKNEDK